jgi:hypothetical protein
MLHIQVETDAVVQGLEMKPLEVFPAECARKQPDEQAATPDQRLLVAWACDGDVAPRVEVCTKDFGKALAAAAATDPDFLLLSCGDAEKRLLHLMCTFRLPSGELDPKSALHIWMISRADDE